MALIEVILLFPPVTMWDVIFLCILVTTPCYQTVFSNKQLKLYFNMCFMHIFT